MAAQDGSEDTKTSAASNIDQTKEIYPFTDDVIPKVRKPYTITKQRQKWTDEEHQRFLEALKLYGRGWCQIEEHVGSKTAVQIRSHAQKFFSKVARGANGNPDGSLALVEIPPPRPKRKPVHPYPRKSLDAKGTSNSYQSERSPSPNYSSVEKETGSPTSVLSSIYSEGQQSGSQSPASCTTELQPSMNLAIARKASSVNEEEELGKGCTTSSPRKFPTMSCNSKMKSSLLPDEIRGIAQPSAVIKLFGRTVTLAEVQKPVLGKGCLATEDDKKLDESSLLNENQDTQLSLGKIYNRPIPCTAIRVSSDSPLQWLQLYYPAWLNQPPVPDATDGKEKSCSGSNSNMNSTNEAETLDRNTDAVGSSSENMPCESRKGQRGFVPYKRCATESVVRSGETEERPTHRPRVCL